MMAGPRPPGNIRTMNECVLSRDDLASMYLDQLPYAPYPVQEEALLAWFTAEQGVLVCAPTGTGKTLIAEAALFEALHTNRIAYYTTPLIALTEQKFREMQDAAVRWGFSASDIGLVTGNRSVNAQARVLVVVAEILLNRLLHPAAFDFSNVAAVVMDEFHSFADPERGIVWELSLALLPAHVRLLLLSATVGNSVDFILWLARSHGRKVQLVQSSDRKVPLRYTYVEDQLLNEHLEWMAGGEADLRKTPALVFCFNREECWSVAEQLKGKSLLSGTQQKQLAAEIEAYDWSQGAGPKLKKILLRGVGVHHAGMLPKYRRIVENLFQKKLLSVAVCTETLSAGINLPARSVVLTSLVKGPPNKKKIIDASSAHQMFGRAGRPQYDTEGSVYALAHEDDVKILRWKKQYDQIPEDTKDPGLRAAKKKLKKKMPTRRKNETYWNEAQFEKLKTAPPARLASTGQLPWRLLAYLLEISPEVELLRNVVRKRLVDENRLKSGEKALNQMLLTLWAGGYVTLEPEPPPPDAAVPPASGGGTRQEDAKPTGKGTFGALLADARQAALGPRGCRDGGKVDEKEPADLGYQPMRAHPTPELPQLTVFRSVNPLYGAYLIRHLGIADDFERIQALESVLEMPGSMARYLRVPKFEDLPPGPLALTRLDTALIGRGLVTAEDLQPKRGENLTWEERWVPTLAEKLRLLFDSEFPGVTDLRTQPVWAAGDLLTLGGDFNKYVTSRELVRQEGMVFRHLLRLILLCREFSQVAPPDEKPEDWRAEMVELSQQLADSCRAVDPDSTDRALEEADRTADVLAGEPGAAK